MRRNASFPVLSHTTKVFFAIYTKDLTDSIRAALDKFEAWCETQRPLLDNPQYEITQKDKHAALLILGVKAFVWPTEGYPERVKLEFCPPDINRFCDFDFTE